MAQMSRPQLSAFERDQDLQYAFWDQWLRLRDAVLEDRHPRFKLPTSVKERLQPAIARAPSSTPASHSRLPGRSNGVNSTHPPADMQNNSVAGVANAKAYSQNASTLVDNIAPKSGIDPILLTKSDDLIKAEIQLKRQRIERQLKEAVDQRKHSSRYRDSEEAAPLTALTETWQKALEIVKPISGLVAPANVQTAASDSFDENSYYSSQANDWSSEEASPKNNSRQAQVAASKKAAGLASSVSLPKHRVSEIERLDKQLHSPLQDQTSYSYANDSEAVYDAEREDSEEYSPPAADAFSGPDGDADAMELDDDSSEFVPQDAEVPSPQVPVITNHLSHLAAPQPARVSPLAVAKVPGLGEYAAIRDQRPASPRVQHPAAHLVSDDSTPSLRGSGQPSPAGPHNKKQKLKNRKRKREAEAAANKARKTHNKPAVPSPEPYIKPEPMSPPPVGELSELQPVRARPHQQLHPDVEIVAAPRQGYYPDPPPPQPMRYGYDGVSSPGVVRVASPAAYARPRRDDQDLRRVASLHAAQRPMSPAIRAYSPAGYRTVSQPHPERQLRYPEEVVRAPHTQYIRSERSLSPPQIRVAREQYMQSMAPPPLPPPPRKIVVDQYGNRYYANEPEPSGRMSVAPSTRPEPEVFYDRAPSRQSVAYAARPTRGIYEDEILPNMPPPPPPIRRFTEQQEAGPPDYRMYRQREYSRAPEPQYYREEPAPVYIRDGGVSRASVYPSEPTAAPPYVARAYSVRPEMEPARYMSRQPSVAPQTEYVRVADTGMRPPPPQMRAVSVMPGQEYGRPAEARYGFAQAPPQYAPTGTRYADDEGLRGTAGPQEVYVDQYGREVVRRVGY